MKTKSPIALAAISAFCFLLSAVPSGAQFTPQTINVGATANDGTGDSLRTAFGKVNANFLAASNAIADGGGGGVTALELLDATNKIWNATQTALAATNTATQAALTDATNKLQTAITGATNGLSGSSSPTNNATFTGTTTFTGGINETNARATNMFAGITSVANLVTTNGLGISQSALVENLCRTPYTATPFFTNSWSAITQPYFTKTWNSVTLSGVISKSGMDTSKSMILPWGYRPLLDSRLPEAILFGIPSYTSDSLVVQNDGQTFYETSSGGLWGTTSGAYIVPNYFFACAQPGHSTNTMLLIPPNCTNATTLVVMPHGAGGDQQFPIQPSVAGINPFTTAYTTAPMLSNGWAILSDYAHGDAWGSPASFTDYTNAINWALANLQITNIYVLCGSMGGLPGLQIMAAYPQATRFYGIYPVCGLTNIYYGGPSFSGFSNQINTVWPTTPATFLADTAASDPLRMSSSLFAGKRFRYSGSTSDAVAILAYNGTAFSNHVASVATVQFDIATGAHGDVSHWSTNIMNFFNAP